MLGASMDMIQKIEGGKRVVVGLQERSVSAFQKEIIWLYCYGDSGGDSF